MKKIKLSIVTSDEKYLQHLTKRLSGEKDISLLNTIIIKNLQSQMKEVLAFQNLMVKERSDILILDQIILRDLAAMDLEGILDYKDKLPTMKVIIVGNRYNEENVMAMMQGGAQGFFRAEKDDEHLIKCIRVVARGEYWLDAELTKRVFEEVIKEFAEKKDRLKSLAHLSPAKLKMLSPREMEVLALISESMTNEEIADKLFLSPKTVKTHLRNIFSKSGMRNRVEAALVYTRHTQISN
jgi:NarL family two-component system response regulator LiaR